MLAVVSKVKEFISFLAKNSPTIISIIAGIAAGMLAWNVVTMIQGLISAFKVWKTTTEGLTIAQKLLNTAMAANQWDCNNGGFCISDRIGYTFCNE